MIATSAMLAARGEVTPPERVLAPEFFDVLEESVHRFGGVWISPSMTVVRRGDGTAIEPRGLMGHLMVFAIELDQREPDLAQVWLAGALRTFDRLNLTPQGITEAIISYNLGAQRPVETPLSWLECCAALGLRREDA